MIKTSLSFKSQSGRRTLKSEPVEGVLHLAGDNNFDFALTRIKLPTKTGKVLFTEARCTEVRRSGAPPALVFLWRCLPVPCRRHGLESAPFLLP